MSKMVIADVLIVLNRYHRAKSTTFQNPSNLSEKHGMSQHMANCNHLVREGFGDRSNLLQFLQCGGHRLFQNQIIAFGQQSPNIPQMQFILGGNDDHIGQPGLLH